MSEGKLVVIAVDGSGQADDALQCLYNNLLYMYTIS